MPPHFAFSPYGTYNFPNVQTDLLYIYTPSLPPDITQDRLKYNVEGRTTTGDGQNPEPSA